MPELVLIFGLSQRLAVLALVDGFALLEGKGIEVLPIDVEFSPLVAQVIVLDVLVLLFLLGLGHVGSLFESLLIRE